MTAGSAPDKARKIAAALAAVEQYLQEEAAAAAAVAAAPNARPGLSPWGLSGRLTAIGTRMGSRGSWQSR